MVTMVLPEKGSRNGGFVVAEKERRRRGKEDENGVGNDQSLNNSYKRCRPKAAQIFDRVANIGRLIVYLVQLGSRLMVNLELMFFLGLQVRQTPQGIFINQSKYVQDILKRFDFSGPKSASTPMSTSFQLDVDLFGNPVDQKNYRAIIGSLLYFTASRPDIVFAMGVCARFQCDPRESHLGADSGFELTAFTDSDHACCKLNRKSTSGACQFLGDKLVSWSSRKQNCVSLFAAEEEYVAAACCCSQVLRMKTQLADYGYTMHRIPVYCDFSNAIQITANPVQHSRMKHIDIRCHFIKDHVEKDNIELFFVESERQLADLFTKAFDEKRHYYLLSKIGMLDLPGEDPLFKKYDFWLTQIRTRTKSSLGIAQSIPKGNVQEKPLDGGKNLRSTVRKSKFH
ncbi:hypothetical protein OSB04_002413 [Centaurea solstitialis]|uniref:Reverse transcriptase Ty1/copia-type domain-containing protein n=1 Tax=Centaurea solstitialis TaxID=347529 RepID=A0AA38WMC5_9ASTR|nr:hypothetical protein OSB04_002413 [Centaurea solstitialis]